MRFCLLTTFFPPLHFGGDAVFVANLANALAERDHHVEVVHCADSFEMLRNGVQPSPVLLHPSIRVHKLGSRWGTVSPLITYMTGRPGLKSSQLKTVLSAGFDVVHWHNLSLVGGPGALRYAGGVRLCTLHDYWFICPTHILFKFNSEACTHRNCLRCSLAHRRPPQPWRVDSWLRRAIADVDCFLAPSEFVKQQFRNSRLGIEATVLPHFIPGPLLDSEDNVARQSYYLYVGRLEKAKGLQTIIPLFRKTKRRLLIAGAGNFEPALRAQAGGDSNIEFLGRIPHSNLGSLYAAARAVIVPSVCFETFGLIALEALRHKTPVVVSSYGALPEVTADNRAAFVYRDIPELQRILDEIDAHPDVIQRLARIHENGIQRYSVESHLRAYFQIIEEIRRRDRKRP